MAQVSSKVAGVQPETKTPDVRLADLATTRHRVVADWELRELGFGRGAIRQRLSAGRLHLIHRGVYAVGHRDIGRNGFLAAAVLACGPGAVLSHRTGADHWGLISSASRAIHVTVPRRRPPAPLRGVVVHLTRQLTEADRTEHDGIPVTSVPRTLLDLAGVARQGELLQAIEQAERLRIFDLPAVHELLGRSNGRRGAAALRRALAELTDEAPDTRSPLEDRFVAYCRRRRLPPPALNVMVAGFWVDAAWPSRKVVVELDSRRHHSGIDAFEGDRKRDTKLQIAGFAIVRITDRRLRQEPDELEADLRSLLQ